MKAKILKTLSERDFIKLVKRYLKKNDMTQTQLADEINISRHAMSQMLNFRMAPTPELCDRFGCKKEKLIVIGEIKSE